MKGIYKVHFVEMVMNFNTAVVCNVTLCDPVG
jgi:hypothetical protein